MDQDDELTIAKGYDQAPPEEPVYDRGGGWWVGVAFAGGLFWAWLIPWGC